MTIIPRRFALLVTLLLAAGNAVMALVADGGGETAIRIEDDNAIYTAQVASVGTFEYVLTYEIYFKGDRTKTEIALPPDGLVFEDVTVAEIAGDFAKPNAPALKACIGEVCRQLGIKTRKILISKTGIVLEADPGKRGLVRGELVHLEAAAGWVDLIKTGADETTTPSPKLATILPQLAGESQAIFAAKPKFKFSLSPLTQDQMNAGGDNAASVFFDGGLKRARSSYQYGLSYSGTLATEDNVSLSQINAGMDLGLNLAGKRGGFLPLDFHGGAESDQGANLVNGKTGLSLQYLMPFNVNFSPTDKGYIPNTGPVLEILAEAGWKLSESRQFEATGGNPDNFVRLGYSLRWTIPVARDTILRFHAAGIRVSSSDLTEDESHNLREFSLETKIGNLTYYFGYQKGEAAPLFRAIETTQAGILLKFGDQFECSKPPDGAAVSCNKL